MYAIVELGGRQWKVEPGTRLEVNRIPAEVGATHTVERVVFAQDGSQIQVGRPYVPQARVVCEVLAHVRGPKVLSYHFRRRENWRKTVGHRQQLSRLQVKEIVIGGVSAGGQAAAQAVTTDEQTPPRAPATGGAKPKAAAPPKAPAVHPAPLQRSLRGGGVKRAPKAIARPSPRRTTGA